jgi:hypothetical protein
VTAIRSVAENFGCAPGSPLPLDPSGGARCRPAAAIDRGVVVPDVNDGYTGRAPDLGALEAGQPLPVYGHRLLQ